MARRQWLKSARDDHARVNGERRILAFPAFSGDSCMKVWALVGEGVTPPGALAWVMPA